MKSFHAITIAAGLACTAVSSHAALTLSLNAANAGQIVFSGGSFSFQPAFPPTYNTIVAGSTGGAGDSMSDLAYLTGTFTFNSAGVVTGGTGSVGIFDGVNTLTAVLTYTSISESANGIGGTYGVLGVANLTSISYSGSQSDLKTLALSGHAIDTVAFTFSQNPPPTLAQLATGNFTTSFSESITTMGVPPVPEASSFIAAALLLLPLGMSTFRVIRRNSNSLSR